MRDFKPKRSNQVTATRYTRTAVKPNRKRREAKPPRDWRGCFSRLYRFCKWPSLACGATLLLFVIFNAGKSTIYDSNFFRVASVQVISTGRIEAGLIREISGVQNGLSMFDLDLNTIGARIEKNPWVNTAEVERVFPRTVTIKVTEFTPAAIINHGCLYYVAQDGTIFKPLEMGEKINFPLLTGMEQKDILQNQKETRLLLAGAVRLAELLRTRKSFNLEKLSEIHIDPLQGYELMTLQGGVPVKIGFDNFEPKLARLDRIYAEIESRLSVTQYIDLNAADRVVVKLDPIVTQSKQEKS
jgi:cell division protein FtsQ